ncbi:MAG: hypothetical protein MUF71_17555 [Candidatus Kapabacteria bacterium]|jgi:hypothetical protein|nr:hypothetical protein [Candidatus Kapabacteria bacterium]
MKPRIISTILAFMLTLGITGCYTDNVFIPQEPVVAFSDNVNTARQVPGGTITLRLSLQAAGGLKELSVRRGQTEVIKRTYSDKFIDRLELVDTIPATARENDVLNYSILLTDVQGRTAPALEYRVTVVGATFNVADTLVAGQQMRRVRGNINANYVFSAARPWFLDGAVFVDEGRTLTIEPGTRIYARFGGANLASMLVISQGAQIIAEGTRENPIVMTSERTLRNMANRGDWAGLVINGRAQTSAGAGSVIPGGVGAFGGMNDDDNSGSLRYIRVEYAGQILPNTGSFQLNGISFHGVGRGTKAEYLTVFNSANQGIRFYGGTVNVKYAAVFGSGQYEFRADFGWRGQGQFWLGMQRRDTAAERVFELRNSPDGSSNTTEPRTDGTIANFTGIGPGQASGFPNYGVRVRNGAFGRLYNGILTEMPENAIRFDNFTATDLGTRGVFANSYLFNNRRNNHSGAALFLEMARFGNALTAVQGVDLNNFVGSGASTFNPQTLGSFFSPAQFSGAVQNAANDWTRGGWVRELNGQIRQ